VLLCGEPVTEVMSDLALARTRQRLTGRYPAHRGVYEPLALLPYQSIVPFHCDFAMGEAGAQRG
jgi:hypothetical protein